MKKRTIFPTFLGFTALSAVVLSNCGGYDGVDTGIEGEITVMLWSGDNSYMEDIGRRKIPPEELRGQNQAAAYAVAREFNRIYPNVKINVFAKSDGPDDENGSWAQHRENFRAEYGRYPDIWAAADIPGDIARGLITDLSRFANDPLYQSFNPAIMELMNYDGFQAGLPQFLLPWGVFVNRALAENNNLDLPDPDWDIDDFTDFIAQADMDTFYGIDVPPLAFIETGTRSIRYMLNNYQEGDFVDLTSDEVRDLVGFLPEWAEYAIWPNHAGGNIPDEVMDEHWWWGYKFFIDGRMLALPGDPWMMGDAAHPNPDHWGAAQSGDWDIYPRPSTPYRPNTVGVVLDPMVVYNYAADDGNPEMSPEEEGRAKLAYTFMAFWGGDTRSWRARSEQLFSDGEVLRSAMNDSLPFVSDPETFNEQMVYWYSIETHRRFADEALMPGFHTVLDIWREGEVWDVSDKVFPWYHDFEGERRVNFHEWWQIGSEEAAGASWLSPNLADVVRSNLSDWNRGVNENFARSYAELREGLAEFYPE